MATKRLKKKRTWVKRPELMSLKCIYSTRLIIPGDKTVTGTRYEFMPGQVRNDILADDYIGLLSLQKEQKACCGAPPGPTIRYFSEV